MVILDGNCIKNKKYEVHFICYCKSFSDENKMRKKNNTLKSLFSN